MSVQCRPRNGFSLATDDELQKSAALANTTASATSAGGCDEDRIFSNRTKAANLIRTISSKTDRQQNRDISENAPDSPKTYKRLLISTGIRPHALTPPSARPAPIHRMLQDFGWEKQAGELARNCSCPESRARSLNRNPLAAVGKIQYSGGTRVDEWCWVSIRALCLAQERLEG